MIQGWVQCTLPCVCGSKAAGCELWCGAAQGTGSWPVQAMGLECSNPTFATVGSPARSGESPWALPKDWVSWGSELGRKWTFLQNIPFQVAGKEQQAQCFWSCRPLSGLQKQSGLCAEAQLRALKSWTLGCHPLLSPLRYQSWFYFLVPYLQIKLSKLCYSDILFL